MVDGAAPMRLILAGGGDAADSQPLDAVLARWLETRPVLYLPIAMDPRRHPYEACHAWVCATFAPFGFHERDIVLWSDIVGKTDADLAPFGAVYIGGGNTFKLLHAVRMTGFDAVLTRFVRRGGAVYGGSAGAILLGEDIATCAHMDTNEVGLQDTTGLRLAHGYAVWCHYEFGDDDARIVAFVARSGHPVVALSERAGVVIQGASMAAAGRKPVAVFRDGTQSLIPPGMPVPTSLADAAGQ